MATLVARCLLLLALPLAGCAVSAGAASTGDRAVNRCQTDGDCAGDGVCIDQVCAAQGGALSSVLVSVSPAFAGGTYYFDYPTDSDPNPDDMNVPPLVSFVGSVSIDTTLCSPTFIPTDGTSIGISDPDGNPDTFEGLLPADVTFVPTGRAAGLPQDMYRGTVRGDGYSFGANLPPGNYDIYFRPYKQPLDEKGNTLCPVPPRLLLNQRVTGSLEFKLKLAQSLTVHVVWAKDASPEGWIVDLIDPSTGYPISTSRVIHPKDDVIDTGSTRDATYEIKLDYVPTYAFDADGVLQPQPVGTDVVRIRPPEVPGYPPPVAPILLAQLTGAVLGNDGDPKKPAVVRQSNPVPDKVTLEITTEIAKGHKPTAANVVLTATSLPGFPEVFTSFTRTVTTDATGYATVDVLPGTYRVVATPRTPCAETECLGTAETTWTVAATAGEQGGRLLEFLRAAVISGRAAVPNGEAAVGAMVRALPSASIVDSNVMNQGDAVSPSLPRATFGQVDGAGDFVLDVDAGMYDFRVEPDPTTGFGWYVRPKVTVGASVDAFVDARLPLPVVHRGTVSSGTGDSRVTLPSALIRAFAYITRDGTLTPTPTPESIAIQVAETHSDGAGNFSLLLPSSVGEQ